MNDRSRTHPIDCMMKGEILCREPGMIRKLFVLCLTLLLVIPVFAEGAAIMLNELDGQRIGIPSGSSFDQLIEDRFPQAELMYFGNQSDLLAALSAGKIDAFPSDEPVIRYIMTQRSDVTYIPEYLDTFDFAYCFAKTEDGQRLCGQFSEFIAGLKADGTFGFPAMKARKRCRIFLRSRRKTACCGWPRTAIMCPLNTCATARWWAMT